MNHDFPGSPFGRGFANFKKLLGLIYHLDFPGPKRLGLLDTVSNLYCYFQEIWQMGSGPKGFNMSFWRIMMFSDVWSSADVSQRLARQAGRSQTEKTSQRSAGHRHRATEMARRQDVETVETTTREKREKREKRETKSGKKWKNHAFFRSQMAFPARIWSISTYFYSSCRRSRKF